MSEAPFQTVSEFCRDHPPPRKSRTPIRLVHCINPFRAEDGSEHKRAQSVTVASMNRARCFAAQFRHEVSVDLVSVVLPGDEMLTLGIDFDEEILLNRTVLDVANFRVPRRLPLIYDIISAPAVRPEWVLLYTNIDIAVVPSFYVALAELFQRGADCVVINRRTISPAYGDTEDLSVMTLEVGEPHPGFDCFAFRGELRDRMRPFLSCSGAGGVMLPLLYNLLATADLPTILLDAHATFHIGDDRVWRHPKFSDYIDFNRQETDRVFEALLMDQEAAKKLVCRLMASHHPWVFPNRLRLRAGVPPAKKASFVRRVLYRFGPAV